MSRSALILSCAIHGSVLAVVGWSTLLVAPHPEDRGTRMSVSLSPAESALVLEESSTPQLSPEDAVLPVEAAFTPPTPTIEPMPAPMPPSIPTTADMPQKAPMVSPPKKERAPRTASATGRRGASSGAISGTSAGNASGSGYVPPQFLLRYKPPYPAEARAQRIEGVVLLLVGVDAEGRVTSANIRQGSGHAVLDRAALESVRSWRFTPASREGRAISATVEIPIRFNFSA